MIGSVRETENNGGGRIKMMNFLEMMQGPTIEAGIPVTKSPVKTMFDHGLHNKRNKMIIYDDEPRIEAVMKAALDRHENKMKDHEDFI